MPLPLLFALTMTLGAAEPTTPQLGTLPPDAIRQVVREHAAAIRACYEGVPVDERGFGKVVVRWVIDGTGHVTEAAPKETQETLSPRVGTCVSADILSWTFPKPTGGGKVIVNYPLVFRTNDSPGSPATNDVAAAIDASPEVDRCYDELVKRVPDARGVVSIRVAVGNDGAVIRSRLVSSSKIAQELTDGALRDCLRTAVLGLRVGPRASPTVLTAVHAFGVTLTEQEKLALAQVWAPSVDETQDDERCRNDDKDACTRIGLAFEAGRRVDTAAKDKAREFYTRGCELLSAVACDSLGALIERSAAGQGDLARRAYGEGCALGHAPSCHPR